MPKVSPEIIFRKHRPKVLVDLVKEQGDDCFLSPFDEDYMHLLPDLSKEYKSQGYKYSKSSGVMLTNLVYVEPHTDGSVGCLETDTALFGLLAGGKNLKLMVRKKDSIYWQSFYMYPGDWIMFNDSDEHLVMAETKWTGLAIQIGNGETQ